MDNVPSFKVAYYQLDEEPREMPLSRKDFFKVWLINNKGILHFAGESFAVDQPALVFLNPLVPYGFAPVEKERSGYWCVFTEGFLAADSRRENLRESPLFKIDEASIFYLDENNLTVVRFLFEQIVHDYQSEYVYKYDSIRNQLSLLIHQGMKMQPVSQRDQRQNAAFRITGRFLNLLESQYPLETLQVPLGLRKPKDYADKLAVHVNHLNAVVQQVTGKSTSAHIAERMLNESRALLSFSDWSIAEIAYSLGFEYPNHFSNFFKKHTGVTPLSVRK